MTEATEFLKLNPHSYQARVNAWMLACFGSEIATNKRERAFRFLEEALELAQAVGIDHSEVVMLANYVDSRPKGHPPQEVGGVMVTLAALCTPHDLNLRLAGNEELKRCWLNIDKIRKKQAAKREALGPLP